MVSSHTGIWGQTLVETLRKRGISDQAIVGNTGISLRLLEGDEPRLSFEDLATLFERAAELTRDDLIGFKHGQTGEYRRGGLATYTSISSPTTRTLLNNLVRYQRIFSEAIDMNSSMLDDHGIIGWHYQVPHDVVRRQYVEFDAAGIIDVIRRLTNRRVTPRKVEFRHFRDTNTKQISMFFGCPIEFGCHENRITLKLDDLDLPLRSADDNLHRLLRKFSEEALQKLGRNTPSIVIAVEENIAKDPTRSQADVAKELGMSPRTLSRRLTDADATFFGIVEAYRETMAKRMLAETAMQIAEVAFVLGYADASAFSTAFKRWVGSTPTQYRGRKE